MIRIAKSAAVVLVLCAATCLLAANSAPMPTALPAAEAPTPGMIYVATLGNGFTFRFHHRRSFEGISRLYFSSAEDNFVDVPSEQMVSLSQEPLPPPPPKPQTGVTGAVNAASDRHLIDADLINSVIRAESGFNPKAVSPKGARGLMQLMPGTAQRLGIQDSFNTDANVDAGTRYLRELLARYDNDLVRALAAYNAGPQRVEQYHGVPPYHETRAYVARVIREFNRKKLAQRRTAAGRQQRANGKTAAAPTPASD